MSHPPKFLTFRICLAILCFYAFAAYFDSAHAETSEQKPIVAPSGVIIVIPIPPAYVDPTYA